jgi:cysteinyl-tRNA synthetase
MELRLVSDTGAGVRVFNDLTGKREDFTPQRPGQVGMYVCGPTVYDYFHIGNARTFLVFDTIRRYLEYRGFRVTYVQNITDIDDKIIQRAARDGVASEEIAARYTAAYVEDARALGVRPPDFGPKATEHLPEIVRLIATLIAGQNAYVVEGDVYFDTTSFPGYGKLSRQSLADLEAGARVEVDERKRHAADFALWKSRKPGEPWWPSPWGDGRPGWHIECSAMGMRYLGETMDIHAGGADLIFPHHENEIAQSEAATGRPFARYWLHSAFLTVGGQRMGKSLGNFLAVRDLLKDYASDVIRLFLLSAHYRSPLNYSEESIRGARGAMGRIRDAVTSLEQWAGAGAGGGGRGTVGGETGGSAGGVDLGEDEGAKGLPARLPSYRDRFIAAMDDDFNTADAISVIFDLVRDAYLSLDDGHAGAQVARPQLPAAARGTLTVLRELAGVLGLLGRPEDEGPLPEEIQSLIKLRQEARAKRDWRAADRIRDDLASRGVVLEDTPLGVRWKRRT